MKSRNAYFTVEATLVLPLVMGTLFFAVYLLLFQYNRCLLEQDAGALAMWGSMLEGGEEVISSELEKRMKNIFWEKYLAWEMERFDVKMQNNSCRVKVGGRVPFPLPEWNFWNNENEWSAESEWSYPKLHPVEFVRMCNRLKNKGE